MRVLVLATTTGYQTRAFGEAAARLGVDLVFATDRCHLLEDPWQDGAIPIRFHDEDASVAAILDAAHARSLDGLLVVGDRPTVIAARTAASLGLPWHPPEAAAIARNKLRTRECLRAAGLPSPWWLAASVQSAIPNPRMLSYPCVVKPVSLSGSRGVIRANDAHEFAAAWQRLRALMRSPEIRAERDETHETALVEGFIPGREYAIEGLMEHGVLHVLALFDKPDPLDGPFFEETIYLTPSAASDSGRRAIVDGVARAARAMGLCHGPVHAECRVNDAGVHILEVAARPIGGLCAESLQFVEKWSAAEKEGPPFFPLADILLRHALGENAGTWCRERDASGVMMIPIPRRGIYRGVDGADAARAVPHVDDVRITAKADQLLVPLPEGASYLGFIFARAAAAADVERALREAHARLRFAVDPELPLLTAAQINYNLSHG